MSRSDSPCLSICVEPLKATTASQHFAIWVVKAPYPGGYVHHDSIWPKDLSQTWYAWQEMFCNHRPLQLFPSLEQPTTEPPTGEGSLSSRLMQQLGLNLWKWLCDGTVQNSFAHSRGIALGQDKPLRLRLEIRDPNLIVLPWEIMQQGAGQPAIALNPQILFSRTTSDVDPLPHTSPSPALNILLVLGEDKLSPIGGSPSSLQLQQEATKIAEILQISETTATPQTVPCTVHTLIQPTPAELITRLQTGLYNVFFYAGHGISAPDGGQLLLRPNTSLSGTELAGSLVSNKVSLALFNSCWGAQSDTYNSLPIPRSSLAEVLIHHGVPAVLAMRDSIADTEALSFVQAFTRALANRVPVDRAACIARQHLLTLYKFNQPAWTLPVLYMHPEYNGELIQTNEEVSTELPQNSPTWIGKRITGAYLRSEIEPTKIWPVRGGFMRVGRVPENDLKIEERWVSQKHAEIFYRDTSNSTQTAYFLRDFSRYGTLVLSTQGWQKIHHQEITLQSGMQIKFGSSQGQTWQFIIQDIPPT